MPDDGQKAIYIKKQVLPSLNSFNNLPIRYPYL